VETELKEILDSVIIRFSGELWLKKHWTRRHYEKQLLKNLKRALKHYEVPYSQFVRRHSRFYLKTDSALEASRRLAHIFGVSSVSPALETSSNLEDVLDKGEFLARSVLKKRDNFAVRCKRVGKQGYSSADVRRFLGQRVLDELGDKLHLRVDLGCPDVVLGVEVRDEEAFVYSEMISGVGGMPLGTQPKLVALFSGGIDSAVACWLVMKRGSPVIPVYFDNSPFTDETTTERALRVAEALLSWAVGFPRRVYVVQHGENLAHIMETKRKYSCLLCKRMMYRIAGRLAEQFRAEGIVTGEAIGEQASQTLTNLRVLNDAVEEYPVHRPLLGFDKIETEALARRIGTYKVSSKSVGACTVAPYSPSTKAKLEEVKKAEERLNIKQMIEKTLKTIKIVEI
jgi:thiamine biosynthesis protein ThiI